MILVLRLCDTCFKVVCDTCFKVVLKRQEYGDIYKNIFHFLSII